MRQTRKEIGPGVYLTCLQTDKFKMGLLSVTLLTSLERETAAQNALIPSVLRRGTAKSPDMDALAARLDGLYGASVEPTVRKRGEIQCVGLAADFVDDAWLPAGEDLLESIAELLGEMLLAPNTRGGLLLPQYVESEKQRLLEELRARVNDKFSYSRYRLMELMCPGERYAVDALGDEEHAANIGYVPLTRRYRTLLASSPVEVFYCGTADPVRVERAVRDALAPLPRGELDMDIGTDIRMNTVEPTRRVFLEDMDVAQGKLVIGYRLGEVMEEPDLAALVVMNTLFGGGVSSKLHVNVREKLGLCYFASSELDVMKGVITVSSGIKADDYERALEEIDRQLQAVKDGQFTDAELDAARIASSSDLLAMMDDPAVLERSWLNQNLLGLECGPDDLAALAAEVTRQDVIAAASDMECDAVYFLRGAGSDDDGGEI